MRNPSYIETVAASYDDFGDGRDWDWNFGDEIEPEWTDEDEAALEEWEERRRERLAEDNEY